MQALSGAARARPVIGELIERKSKTKGKLRTLARSDDSRPYVQAISRKIGDPSRFNLDKLLDQHKEFVGIERLGIRRCNDQQQKPIVLVEGRGELTGNATRAAERVRRSIFLFGRNNLISPFGPIYA